MFPICRSITGDGLRETLRLVGRDVPLELVEMPTGTQVLDWTVPNEWNIRGAWIDGAGRDACHRLRGLEPSRPQLQRPGRRRRLARGAPRARVHAPGESRPRPVPHLVLRRALGLLHEPAGSSTRSSRATTTSSSTRPSSRARHLRRVRRSQARPPTRSCSRPTRAIPPWPTTISRASPLLTELGTHARRAVELRYTYRSSGRPGTIGALCWLARNRDAVERDQARPCPVLSRRPRPVHVQAEPPRRRRHRPGRSLTSSGDPGKPCRSIGSRTAVTSASSARRGSICRSVPSRAPRPTVPRVPLVGRRSRLRATRRTSATSFAALIDVIDVLESNDDVSRTSARTASPSSAGAAFTADSEAARARRWRCSGSSASPTAPTACSIIADRSGLGFTEIRDVAEQPGGARPPRSRSMSGRRVARHSPHSPRPR